MNEVEHTPTEGRPTVSGEQIASRYLAWKERYQERDERMALMADVIAGDFTQIFDPDEETVDSRSPNLIQVALEDTAEAASLMPTVRIQSPKPTQNSKRTAAQMERVSMGYLQANDIDWLIPEAVQDMGAFGLSVWSITPDPDRGVRIERRNPRHCYPEPGFRPGDDVAKCIFAREVYFDQLPPQHQAILIEDMAERDYDTDKILDENAKVVILEHYDQQGYTMAGLYQGSVSPAGSQFKSATGGTPVLLEWIEWKTDDPVCPVVIGARLTLDKEFRGQYDQVVGLLEAHIRLMGLVVDYADQSVYSEIWVRDLIGEMPYGGGGFIQLGPQGAVGRIPPATSSFNLQADLEGLVDGIHVGGRWPKARPGEVDQSIASAKFIEASAGMMNTAIRTYHQILQRMLERTIRIAFALDKAHSKGKRASIGVLRNQNFIEQYDPQLLDPEMHVRVEYGLGLGREPSTSAVMHIQYGQANLISDEFIQENIDGLTDVARERARIDLQQFRNMALAKLLEGLDTGTVPPTALVEVARAREKGDDLFDLYDKYVVQPQMEAQDAQVETGMGGPPLEPGAGGPPGPGGPGAPGPLPPAPPGGGDLMAALGMAGGSGGPEQSTQMNAGPGALPPIASSRT